jgi:hypothetical protein
MVIFDQHDIAPSRGTARQQEDHALRSGRSGVEATTRIELVYTVLQFYLGDAVLYRAAAYFPFR